MTTQPRSDALLAHLVETLRLLDERIGVAIERAIAAERAGQWQQITPDPRSDEQRFGQDH